MLSSLSSAHRPRILGVFQDVHDYGADQQQHVRSSMALAIQELGNLDDVALYCPHVEHELSLVIRKLLLPTGVLKEWTAVILYNLRHAPSWLSPPSRVELLVKHTLGHVQRVKWPSAETLLTSHPLANSWPFPRFELDDVKQGLWRYLVERFKDLEIWTGTQTLQDMKVPEFLMTGHPFYEGLETAMSKMCRFVLTGDLLRLNETALPPFAQHLVLADEELALEFERPQRHCYLLAWRFDADLSASARRVIERGCKIDQFWSDKLMEAVGHSRLLGPLERARFLTTSAIAAEVVQVAMGEFFFRQLQTFSVDVAEMLCEALELTRRLPGIYLEIGVFKGASAFVVLQYLERQRAISRPVVLMDTFSGFNYSEAADSMDRGWHGTHKVFADPMEHMNYLQDFLGQTSVPFTLLQANILSDDVPHEDIAVANIDVDMFETTLAALTKVAPRIVLGGVILLEDVTATPLLTGSLAALDEFLESKNGLDFSKLLTRGGVLLIRVKSHDVDVPTSCESEKSLALQNCFDHL